jgi:hypothetical protein
MQASTYITAYTYFVSAVAEICMKYHKKHRHGINSPANVIFY